MKTVTPARKPLEPRIDLSLRPGTKRTIKIGEAWAPLAQNVHGDDVLYTDIRFMDDNLDNTEGNIGIGYRRVVPEANAVLGGHVWVDRRRTSNDSISHQITTGAEYLGKDFDVLANAYIPLNKARHISAGNATRTDPFLAGSGIYYEVSGDIIEEPQAGFDVEFGIPITWDAVDSLRLYGGVYSFYGDETPDVSGTRFRARADINQAISVGTRLQHDNARGNQAFIEATIRFPFYSKLSHKENGLRARLDESPERDIDIVTGQVTTAPVVTPVLNSESGTAQNIVYVDNSAAGGGNGSLETPFNTLADAEAVLADNDILYIARGDGLVTGQNTGLDITKNNVMVVGSGVDFTWDGTRFSASGSTASNGTVLKAATSKPLISNNAGDGIYIAGTNAYLTGLTVTGATGHGIYGLADGTDLGTITVRDTTLDNNDGFGLIINATNGGHIDTITLSDVTSTNNDSFGAQINAQSAASIDDIAISDSDFSNNNLPGIRIESNGAGSVIDNVNVTDTTLSNNVNNGLMFYAQAGGTTNTVTANRVTSTGNSGHGVVVRTTTAGSIGTATISNSTLNDATGTGRGIFFSVEGAGSAITRGTILNNTTNNNARQGIYVYSNDGQLDGTLIQGNTVTGNGENGVFVNDDTLNAFLVDMGGGALGSTGQNRIFANTGEDIRVDVDTDTLKAENNWWGVGTGLAGGETALDGVSAIDATPFLAVDPNP